MGVEIIQAKYGATSETYAVKPRHTATTAGFHKYAQHFPNLRVEEGCAAEVDGLEVSRYVPLMIASSMS